MASTWDKKWKISVFYDPDMSDNLGLVDSIPDLSDEQMKLSEKSFWGNSNYGRIVRDEIIALGSF